MATKSISNTFNLTHQHLHQILPQGIMQTRGWLNNIVEKG